jgi:ribosomal protein L40E
MMASSVARAITILVLLASIEGTILLVGGLLLLIFSGAVGGIVSTFGGAVAGFLLVSALFNFIVAYGFWNGFGWAWWVGLVLAIVGVIRAILVMGLGTMTMALSLIINNLMIYYLTRPHVRKYLGRSKPQTLPLSAQSRATPQERTLITCQNCGATNDPSASFCNTCGIQLRPQGS